MKIILAEGPLTPEVEVISTVAEGNVAPPWTPEVLQFLEVAGLGVAQDFRHQQVLDVVPVLSSEVRTEKNTCSVSLIAGRLSKLSCALNTDEEP